METSDENRGKVGTEIPLNSCSIPSITDPAVGFPLQGLPQEFQKADANKDKYIHGLSELTLLGRVVRELPSNAENSRLFPWVPQINRQDEGKGKYEIIHHGIPVQVLSASGGPLEERFLEGLATALQLYPKGIFKDLVRHASPIFTIGEREDLIHFFNNLEKPQVADVFRGELPAITNNNYDPKNPEETKTYIALTTDLLGMSVFLQNSMRYGCAEDNFTLNGLFYVTLHEMGHAVDGALAHQIGLGPALSKNPNSLIPVMVDQIKETDPKKGAQLGKWQREMFAETFTRVLLCRNLSEKESYPPELLMTPYPFATVVEYPNLPRESWEYLMKSFHLVFQDDELNPMTFISSL